MVMTTCECSCHGVVVPRDICVHCWTSARREEFEKTQNAIEKYGMSEGGRWADLQSETEALDGDQAV